MGMHFTDMNLSKFKSKSLVSLFYFVYPVDVEWPRRLLSSREYSSSSLIQLLFSWGVLTCFFAIFCPLLLLNRPGRWSCQGSILQSLWSSCLFYLSLCTEVFPHVALSHFVPLSVWICPMGWRYPGFFHGLIRSYHCSCSFVPYSNWCSFRIFGGEIFPRFSYCWG